MFDSLVQNETPTLGSLSYIKAELYADEKPYFFSGPLPHDKSALRTNIFYQVQDNIPFYDLRKHDESPKIESHGFEFLKIPSAVDLRRPLDDTLHKYLLESVEIIQKHLSADRVICYDYRVSLNIMNESE